MIKTVELRESAHGSNYAQYNYQQNFAKKFELVEDVPNYQALEKFAQKCIDNYSDCSLNGITYQIYMDKVIEMSDEEFIAWAKRYAENSKKC